MRLRPTVIGLVLAAGAAVLRGEGPDAAVPAPDPTAVATQASVEYAPGRGLLFHSSDGLFEASLGFNLQVRYTHTDADAESSGVDSDEFRVRRFKLCLTGYAWDPRLTWRFQAAFENTAGNRLLDDAWLNYRFSDALQLQGGQYKTPFTREELYNDGVLQFVERSIAVDAFKPSRDIGVMVQGSLPNALLAYQAGVFGGEGENTLRATSRVMPVARLVFNPLGSLGEGEPDLQNHATPVVSFGTNAFLNTLRKTTATTFDAIALNYLASTGWLGHNIALFTTGEDVRIKSWGFDTQFKWRGFFAQAEYFRGQAEGQTSATRLYAYGWYGEAGYCILPGKLDLATRYSLVDANRAVQRDDISTVTGGLNYYIHNHNLKLQLDYTRTHRQRIDGSPTNDQAILVQAQLMP